MAWRISTVSGNPPQGKKKREESDAGDIPESGVLERLDTVTKSSLLIQAAASDQMQER